MVQLWQETDPEQAAVDLVSVEDVPETGFKLVLEGEDPAGQIVALIHEDSAALRRMAVFDVVVNNADRKGAHVLTMGVWGWIGEALRDEELEGVDRVLARLEAELGQQLTELLTAEEIEALAARCALLRSTSVFPAPSGGTPCRAPATVLASPAKPVLDSLGIAVGIGRCVTTRHYCGWHGHHQRGIIFVRDSPSSFTSYLSFFASIRS